MSSEPEPCPSCGSLLRTTDASSIICGQCGTALGTVDSVAEDEEVYDGGKTRAKVLRRKEDKKEKLKASRVYRGRRGWKLFLVAWQYVLWKVCWEAVEVCGVPGRVWEVVRDLWTVWLDKVKDRFEDDVDKIAGESGVSGSESETPGATSEDEDKADSRGKLTTEVSKGPTLIDTVALLCLGLLMLRFPLRLGELFDWIPTERITYIRAIRFVPTDIKRHLAPEHHNALDTVSAPKPEDLQLSVFRLAQMYGNVFGIAVPALNYMPVLLEYVERLALPLQVYEQAKQLNQIVHHLFDYSSNTTSRRKQTAFPEARLMSLVVIATKLLFPFNPASEHIHPSSASEPGSLRLNWPQWLAAKETFDHNAAKAGRDVEGIQSHLTITDNAVMEMPEQSLDVYMDWYQSTYARLEDREDDNLGKQLLDMFPGTKLAKSTALERANKHKKATIYQDSLRQERLRYVLGSLSTQHPISEEETIQICAKGGTVLRPGATYEIFTNVDAPSGAARVFHEEAASIACLTMKQLVGAVRQTEIIIEKWKLAKRRKEMFPEDTDVDMHQVEGEGEDMYGAAVEPL